MSAQELSYWIKRFSLNSSVFKVGPFIIDYESEEISCHGEKLFCPSLNSNFWRLLLESEGKNVSFEVLASALFVDENAYKNIGIKENLRQRAYLIRNKLEESGGNRTWIKNSRSRGYRIEIN
jgi:DNA-binding response OmpR family regulator